MTNTYTINPRNIFWLHGRDRSKRLRDGGDMSDRAERLRVLVKSDDLFITTAANLDDLCKYLEKSDKAANQRLQNIINDLLHLHLNYSVVPKEKDSRS